MYLIVTSAVPLCVPDAHLTCTSYLPYADRMLTLCRLYADLGFTLGLACVNLCFPYADLTVTLWLPFGYLMFLCPPYVYRMVTLCLPCVGLMVTLC